MFTINEDHILYGSWDIKAWRRVFLSFWAIFCPLTLLTTKKSKFQNNEKKTKKPGDISILHSYSTNDDHMIYRPSEMKCDWQKFLSIWTIFCPYNPENQNFEKMKNKKQKNPGIIRILQLYSTNDDHMIYCSSEVKCDWHNFLAIWTFFCPYNPENQNFEKMRKSP